MIPARLLSRIRAITAKRPRTVLEHILKHGHVTTQELKDLYGYNHPPRAARDVREQGIELETFRVVGSDGRRIAAYRLALTKRRAGRAGQGRRPLSKALKQRLLERDGSRCQICAAGMEPRYLQIDHRVPYDIAADEQDPESRPQEFMLLCGPCNRAKSWSCEHCANRKQRKLVRVCKACYWANPMRYSHVAMLPHRRAQVTWVGENTVKAYDALAKEAAERGLTLAELILEILDAAASPRAGH